MKTSTFKIKKYPIDFWVASLYVFMIPSKPLFTINLFYVIGFLCFILYLIRAKGKFEKPHLFEITYVLFLILCFFESLYSPSPYALDLCIRILIYISGVFSAFRLISKYKKGDSFFFYLSNIFINGTLLICLFCILIEGIGDVRLGEYVFEGVYGTYIELSICIMISCILLIAQLFYKTNVRRFNYLKFALLLIFCGLSQTRKVFVAILLMILLLGYWKSRGKILLRLKYIIAGGLLLAIGLYFLSRLEAFNQLIVRFNGMLLYLAGENTYDNSSIVRSNMILIALSNFYKNPILGCGTDGARIYINEFLGVNAYSHCNFAELLCNNGLVGFILFYVFHVMTLVYAYRKRKRFDFFCGILICSVIVLFAMDYGQVSYYNIEYIFFYTLISYIMAYFKSNRDVYS
ncbi:O-antigen ligase family protein [uncultured Traorella sp.]|uniref:O-antigen ligase family protein n=1 Tax=uncultured Traorella sp. TaxID=1929048 RepID=UPI0025DED077|nr:O-antigen ligase family protein [uncultured Traorella sp.]